MIFGFDFLKLYEQLDKLTEEVNKNTNALNTIDTDLAIKNHFGSDILGEQSSIEKEYTNLIYSIKNRADFVGKAQELCDNLPVNMGFRISYPGGRKIFRKQADGSFELSTFSHQIEIIDRTEAVATLQTVASIDNSKIYTYAYYPYADEAYYEHGAVGTRIINQDGSFNYPVHNYIVPQLIQRT